MRHQLSAFMVNIFGKIIPRLFFTTGGPQSSHMDIFQLSLQKKAWSPCKSPLNNFQGVSTSPPDKWVDAFIFIHDHVLAVVIQWNLSHLDRQLLFITDMKQQSKQRKSNKNNFQSSLPIVHSKWLMQPYPQQANLSSNCQPDFCRFKMYEHKPKFAGK